MGRETILFSSEEKTDAQRVAAFLRQLADKILEGQVTLIQGEQQITAQIPPNLVLEIKLEEEPKRERIKRSLEVEIEWIEGDEGAAAQTGVSLG
jgi:amphi-Trp domain-containing protein